jgi:hypothetical protein
MNCEQEECEKCGARINHLHQHSQLCTTTIAIHHRRCWPSQQQQTHQQQISKISSDTLQPLINPPASTPISISADHSKLDMKVKHLHHYQKSSTLSYSYSWLILMIVATMMLVIGTIFIVLDSRRSSVANGSESQVSFVVSDEMLRGRNTLSNMLNNEKFTLYMITYDRDELMLKLVQHYSKSNLVDKIVISWNNIDRKPPSPDVFNSEKPVYIIEETEDSLNNRYRPHPDIITTRAIFNVDDDIQVSLEDLELGFRAWQQHPDQLVGYLARTHGLKATSPYECDSNNDGIKYYYGSGCYQYSWTKYLPWVKSHRRSYSFVLNSACFFHNKYLSMYTNQIDKRLLHLVNHKRNCEDLVFPAMVTNHTLLPSVYVSVGKNNVIHLQDQNTFGKHKGLNQMYDHYKKRTKCLNELEKIYGYLPFLYNPLKLTRVVSDDVD